MGTDEVVDVVIIERGADGLDHVVLSAMAGQSVTIEETRLSARARRSIDAALLGCDGKHGGTLGAQAGGGPFIDVDGINIATSCFWHNINAALRRARWPSTPAWRSMNLVVTRAHLGECGGVNPLDTAAMAVSLGLRRVTGATKFSR